MVVGLSIVVVKQPQKWKELVQRPVLIVPRRGEIAGGVPRLAIQRYFAVSVTGSVAVAVVAIGCGCLGKRQSKKGCDCGEASRGTLQTVQTAAVMVWGVTIVTIAAVTTEAV